MTQKNFQEIIRSIYDENNNLIRTSSTGGGGTSTVFIGTPTLHAVVNTGGSAANVTLNPSPNFIGIVTLANLPDTAAGDLAAQTADLDTIATKTSLIESDTSDILAALNPIKGNLTLSDSKGFIGLVTAVGNFSTSFAGNVTLDAGSKTQIVGNVTLSDPKGFIGLVTVVGSLSPAAGNVTLDDGSLTGIVGNVTLSDSKGFIGLVTVVQGSTARSIVGNLTLSDPKGFIGLVTVVGSLSPAAGNVTLDDGSLTGIVGNVTLSDAKTYIGLTTSTIGNAMVTVTLGTALDSTNDSVSIGGTLPVGPNFIGLVTAWSRNAGTTKTLVSLPVGLGNNSLSTVAVPSSNQKINVTNLLLSSNVTTEVAIKSGVTYLTGNASLGVTLFPGGGFELPGSPDSPSWIGLPSGAIVIEKRDPGGTVSKIGGGLIYFSE